MQRYLRLKERELRDASIRTYRSQIKKLTTWLNNNGHGDIYCAAFNRSMAMKFVDSLEDNGSLKNTTWNNITEFFGTLFNALVEKSYYSENPFAGISKRKKQEKERILIDAQTRARILEYLVPNDYDFLIVCMLVYHALLRPKEITMLRPIDFNFEERHITVRSEVSKSGKLERITISDVLFQYLEKWDFNGATGKQFIFGKNLKPGNESVCPRRLSKKWDVLRTKLDFPQEMKLYSLKDTGIIQMLDDGISPTEVMKQARHSSLEITSIYLELAKPQVSKQIMSKSTGF
jgi:integrase